MRELYKIPFKLGVTGGIGSGKTSVCRVFSMLGIPVFSADEEAKWIMENDDNLILRLNTLAGKNLYKDGVLDRAMLASIVFNDNKLLSKVNSLVHPAVFEKFLIWSGKQSSPYVIIEAAILIESGGASKVDKVVVVTAPLEERISRVVLRSGLTRDQILERINNQADEKELVKSADYVINNSEVDLIIPAILDIHRNILSQINILN